MRKLVYATSLSLDGYIDAEAGDPGWVVPDDELHRHFNDIEREIDTLLGSIYNASPSAHNMCLRTGEHIDGRSRYGLST